MPVHILTISERFLNDSPGKKEKEVFDDESMVPSPYGMSGSAGKIDRKPGLCQRGTDVGESLDLAARLFKPNIADYSDAPLKAEAGMKDVVV